MLNKVTLENFKCFQEETEFLFSQITILYGRNGRGKSTIVQSILLLAQTMVSKNTVNNLQLTGKYAALGTFADVLNSRSANMSFGISLQSGRENIEMEFQSYPNKPQIARITKLDVDGISRVNDTSGGILEMGNIQAEGKALKDSSETKYVESMSDIKTLQALKSVQYISACRRGPQNFTVRKDSLEDDDLGVNGENVINVLARQSTAFIEDVRDTLDRVLGGAAIRVSSNDLERIELFINSKNGEETFKPVNVGFGYSYVLPVIVSAYLAKKDSMLIIENPEAHLHPAAQSRMMEFLVGIAKEKNLQLIIETHSDHIVNGMRIAMKKGTLDVRDAHILFFSDEERPVRIITSDRNGTLNDNPDDFLDEWTLQMLKLV